MNKKSIIGIVVCALTVVSCEVTWEPWKVVWYYEKTLFPDNTPFYVSSRPFPRQEAFPREKYPEYYIDNVFFGLRSDTPRNPWEYERDPRVYNFDVDICMEAADKRGIEKIIIRDIRVVSKSKKDYSAMLNETYPLEIPIDTDDYAEELPSGARIFREHVSRANPSSRENPYRMYIGYDSEIQIDFEKTERFHVFVEAEIVKTAGSTAGEIQFTMKPKRERGLFRWEFIGW